MKSLFAILKRVILTKTNMVIRYVSRGYIIHGKSRRFIFQPEKLSKRLNIFGNTSYRYTCVKFCYLLSGL